jgi:hypothetical protein
MAMPDFLKTERSAAFNRAYRRALEWVNDAAAEDIAEKEAPMFPGISKPSLVAAIARYQQLGTWRRNPVIPREQYEVAMDAFIHAGLFRERYAYEDVVLNTEG